MSYYNSWCKNENAYKLHRILDVGTTRQTLHCMSCGLFRTNTRLAKHASISDALLKQESLNYNTGKGSEYRRQQQSIKQGQKERRTQKISNAIKKFKEGTKGVVTWLKTITQRK